jgi:hypothetical protein
VARLIILLLATFAFAAPATAGGKTKAKPPTITIGPPLYRLALDRAKLELFPDTRRTRAVLTLTISTTATERPRTTRSNELALVLPDTARVLGLGLTVGGRPRVAAKMSLACAASSDCSDTNTWQRFVDLKYSDVDSALVRFMYAVDGVAHYEVHFSPLVKDAPVTVEIELELAPARQLDVASARAIADYVVEIDSVAQKVNPLPERYKAQRIALPKPKLHDTSTDSLIPDFTVRDGVSLLLDASATSQPVSSRP